MTELNWDTYDPYDGKERSLCVVFDLDGSLARHSNRGPFDFAKLGTDTVYEDLKHVNNMYWKDHYSVFLVTGRPEKDSKGLDVRALTVEWLACHNIRYDYLFMRPEGDYRKDTDIKHEIFDREFRDEYDIEVWFDDRNAVVERMRSLGVNVYQVRPGDI